MSVSRKFGRAEYGSLVAWLRANAGEEAVRRVAGWEEASQWPGRVVAVMEYEAFAGLPPDEALARECRYWDEGYANWWVLSDIRQLATPLPCRGNAGMWQLPRLLGSVLGRCFRE